MTTPYFELFTRGEHEVVAFAAGETVFAAGDDAECLYVVRSGTVLLHDGDRELETVGEGGIFGEMALVDGLGRSASATASTDTELVALDERRFQYLVLDDPLLRAGGHEGDGRASPPPGLSGGVRSLEQALVERDRLGGDRRPVEALDRSPAPRLAEALGSRGSRAAR